jgi:hypothetical protein
MQAGRSAHRRRADLSWAVFGKGEGWEKQVEQSLKEHGKTPVEVLRDTGVLRPGTILAHAYYATDRCSATDRLPAPLPKPPPPRWGGGSDRLEVRRS